MGILKKIKDWFETVSNCFIIMCGGIDYLERKRLEEYRRTATVADMAHSGDPSTYVMEPNTDRLISIIEYYRKY